MIIFLYGEDKFRSLKKLFELKEKFKKDVDPSGSDLITIDGDKMAISELNDAASPAALFSRKRMVVIENLFANKDKSIHKDILPVLKKIAAIKEGNIVVLLEPISDKEKLPKDKAVLFKFLSGQRFSQQFKAFASNETSAWIKNRVAEQKMRISSMAITQLIATAGNNLWAIDNELEKLIHYKGSRHEKDTDEIIPIEVEDIKEMVRGAIDENIFSLTDAISAKNKSAAMKMLEEQIDSGVGDSYLLTMIIRQFRILLQIREALDRGLSSRSIASELKLHPFVVQKSMLQVRGYDSKKLKTILKRLAEADNSFKNGIIDIKTSLSMLLATL